jgi:cytochrome P450
MGLRAPHFYPLLGSGIFTQDGPAWKHSRELLRPQFMSNRFQNFEVIQGCVDALLANIPEDSLVDLQPLFFRLTFDTTTFILFGKTFSSLKDDQTAGDESEFAKAFNLSQDYLCSRGRLGDLYWLMGGKEFRNACKTCHDFVDASVQKALQESASIRKDSSEKKNYVFLDALVEETQNPKILRDQCLNVLLAGRDTTACCLSWAL